MPPLDYTPTHRTWIRELAIGVAAGVGADLVRGLVHVAVQFLG
ncbi:DUF6408 family protein [Streptomyces sp. NPDC051994]